MRHLGFTLGMTCIGFALAVVLGVALAVGIVYSRFLERTIYTLLVALNSIPKVALAPLFVIWMGTGPEPKIAIALMLAIFPIVIDTVLGLRSVDPDMLHLARVSKASPWAVLTKIRFPCALPSLFAGMKVAISFALVGAIVGEFVAGSQWHRFPDPGGAGPVRHRPGVRLAAAARHRRNGAVLPGRLRRAPAAAVARLAARPRRPVVCALSLG